MDEIGVLTLNGFLIGLLIGLGIALVINLLMGHNRGE